MAESVTTRAPLSYCVEGIGEPLLLVHGFGVSFNIWKDLLPALRSHYKVVMVELPGIGASPLAASGGSYLAQSVDALDGLQEMLGFESWNVLAYSTGARVVEAYVRAHATRVRGLIFLCPLVMGRGVNVLLRVGLWVDRFLPAFGDLLLTGWRFRFLISLVGFNLKPTLLTDEWFREMSANPRAVLKHTLRMIARSGTRPLSVPPGTYFIWGDEDIAVVQPRRLSSNDFVVHASHAAPVQAAGEVSDLLRSLLADP